MGVVNTQWGKPSLLGLEQSDETRREANSRARPTQGEVGSIDKNCSVVV